MPFAITCPGCKAALRSSKERPIGKGVECPKCAKQFYVSAENQAEVPEIKHPSPVPKAKVSNDDSDRTPPKRRQQAEDSDIEAVRDDDHLRRKEGRSRDDEDDERPRRKGRRSRDHEEVDEKRSEGKRSKKPILILGAVGAAAFLVVSLAAYFLLFSNSGERRALPQQDLPMEMFAYMPDPDSSISFKNLKLKRKLNPASAKDSSWVGLDLPMDSGIEDNQLEAICGFQSQRKPLDPSTEVKVVLFLEPRDIVPMATAMGYVAHPSGRNTFYEPRGIFEEYMFQPNPRMIVFVHTVIPGRAAMDEAPPTRTPALVGRTAANFKMDPMMWDMMKEASGYPEILCSKGGIAPTGRTAHLQGMFTNAEGVFESFSIDVYSTPEGLNTEYERTKTSKGESPDKQKIEQWFWKGKENKLYHLSRTRANK